MAKGRTVSASILTAKDEKIIELCKSISETIAENIDDQQQRKEFVKEFGRTSKTRDGATGRGAGKLQRDALCTRGKQGKAPYSNRNLRWHPLVVADSPSIYASPIERIDVSDEELLVFVIREAEKEFEYPSDRAHEMNRRYVALPEHWMSHVLLLKGWDETQWTQNSCVIPILEACDWQDAVETYAVLGIAVAVEFYGADFERIYSAVTMLMANQSVDPTISLPSLRFPKDQHEITTCPVCRVSIAKTPASLPERTRSQVWQPAWRSTKREEGEDSSIQLMHVQPLVESELRHNASNVRYGHRWCNVAMTDHSLDETLDFMEYIVKAHNRCR